ncbi:MAG: amidase family protein, partial [Nitrososphaerales archaeon]
MKARTLSIVFAALLIIPLVLSACGAAEPTPAPAPTQAPSTAVPPTVAPTAALSEAAVQSVETPTPGSGEAWESDGQNYAEICPALALPQLPADSDALVKSDLPALLPNSTEVLAPSGNHVQFSNPCVVDIVANFVKAPTAKPDLSCIDPTIAFQYPAPVTFAGPGASSAMSITLPPTFMAAGPGQWSDNTMIALTASFPVTKTVDSVIADTAAMLGAKDPKAVDGPTIAGMKSKYVQATPFDIYVFGNEQGAYRVVFDAIDPTMVDFLRAKVYPGLLASVTVGPAPAAKPEATATAQPAETANAANTPRLRALDFAPFEKELAGFTPERAAAVDAIVKGADIAQVQDAVKAGKLTYAELTLYFLARIRQYDETLRTMIELNPDALKEAQAADQRLKDGKATGPMLGIPVTLKDNIETAAPMHTTGGAEILLNNQPKADASFVKQLREAGAVILGKANLSELAGGIMLMPAGVSAVGGQVHNPHGNFSPAGSSAGSGAGTAAYETMVSVGSETSGSLIAPASWNGVVGMYPGHGVVDGANVIPLVKNNDSAGPIGRSVKDVAALLGVIDTQDTDYVAGLDTKALNGVKAAFLKSDVLAQQPNELEDNSDNPAIAQLVTKSLAQAGAKVTDIELTPAGIGTRFNIMVVLLGGVRHDMVPYLVAAGAPIKTMEDLAAYNLKEPKTRIPYGQGTVDAALSVAALKDAKVYEEATQQAKDMATGALDAAFADNKADVLVSVNNYHSAFY